MNRPIRVLIADDSFIVRGGLRTFVSSFPDFTVVGEAVSGKRAVELALSERPDIVLMDLRMRNGDGITATREIAQARPETNVLVVTWSDEPANLRDAIYAGARGYFVHGRFGADELADAMRGLASGRTSVTPILATEMIAESRRGAPEARLTPRELETLALVQRGGTNAEIAAQLGIEEKTVKNHINSIYSKLGFANRLEAMASAPRAR